MSDEKFPENRRDFLALAATTAAAGIGAMLPVASLAAAGAELPSDTADWLNSIPGRYRQVADWPEVNNGMGLIYTLAFLMSAPAGYGVPPGDVGAVLVIRHDTIAIALND